MNTILLCVVSNVIGTAFIYMRFTGAIPIGVFVGIGVILAQLYLISMIKRGVISNGHVR